MVGRRSLAGCGFTRAQLSLQTTRHYVLASGILLKLWSKIRNASNDSYQLVVPIVACISEFYMEILVKNPKRKQRLVPATTGIPWTEFGDPWTACSWRTSCRSSRPSSASSWALSISADSDSNTSTATDKRASDDGIGSETIFLLFLGFWYVLVLAWASLSESSNSSLFVKGNVAQDEPNRQLFMEKYLKLCISRKSWEVCLRANQRSILKPPHVSRLACRILQICGSCLVPFDDLCHWHQPRRIDAGTVADRRASGHGYICTCI